MARKLMNLRDEISNLKEIIQVLSLRLEKLELEMKMLKGSIGLKKL